MSASLFLIVFSLYIAGMVGFSLFLARKQKSGEDFLLGNRSVPFFLMLGTTVATMVGTGSSMGAIGKGYSDGWAGSLYGIGGALGILLLAKLFASARKHQFMTFAEEMSFYYGANKQIKGVVAILVLLASVGWLGAHILGGGLYISWITDIDLTTAKILVALGFGIYVMIGGYMAVVWTDTIQAIVLFLGFLLMAFLSWRHLADSNQTSSLFSKDSFGFLQGAELLPSISLVIVIFVGVMATPAYRQRIYSSDQIKTIKRSFYLSGSLYLIFSALPAIIGMAAYDLHPSLENSNFAFPYMATEVLPVAIGLIVLIAGLSATMSSASSDAIAYCQPPTAYCPLPTAYCLLPIAYCLLPSAHCQLPPVASYQLPTAKLRTAHCPLPTAYCLVPTANCRLPTADCQLPTAHYRLPTVNCLLPTANCPLPLPTANWQLPTAPCALPLTLSHFHFFPFLGQYLCRFHRGYRISGCEITDDDASYGSRQNGGNDRIAPVSIPTCMVDH